MASTDWAEISDVTSTASIKRGSVTNATVTPPAGGGDFVYAIHSLTNSAGIVALYSALTNFTPMAKGGDITGAVMKAGAGGSDCAAFLFVCLNGQASTNSAYILGFSSDEPSHLVLRKGSLVLGLPDVAPGTQGVLRRSSATFSKDTWVHLKLEAISEPGGDVVINVYQSDLTANDVDAPVWAAIAGMGAFTDDALQVATGSAPLTSGRIGFGAVTAEINRIGAFAEVTTARQTAP